MVAARKCFAESLIPELICLYFKYDADKIRWTYMLGSRTRQHGGSDDIESD